MNKKDKKEQAILVVSFGTSYNESRELTIGAIERAVAEAFPEYGVRRAFTSQMIINKLKKRDGLVIDNVEEALQRAVRDGIRRLVVQPTHLMSGYEYMELADTVKQYQDQFERLVVGDPLLTGEEDFWSVIEAVTADTASYDDGDTAVCFMGHGTEARSNEVYAKLQQMIWSAGHENYYIATVEAAPDLAELIQVISERKAYKKAVLIPLMVVAGDHANNDMAGDEEDSWKCTFEREGYQVTCLIRGLGESQRIREIYISHVRAVV